MSVSREVYNKVGNFLTELLQNVASYARNMKDEQILGFYVKEWINYRVSSQVLNGICHYINRYGEPFYIASSVALN